jgi:hypothetical protein
MKSICSAICSAVRGRQHREPVLAFRIVRGAGLDDHADADRRLLVVMHQHHLQAVR